MQHFSGSGKAIFRSSLTVSKQSIYMCLSALLPLCWRFYTRAANFSGVDFIFCHFYRVRATKIAQPCKTTIVEPNRSIAAVLQGKERFFRRFLQFCTIFAKNRRKNRPSPYKTAIMELLRVHNHRFAS